MDDYSHSEYQYTHPTLGRRMEPDPDTSGSEDYDNFANGTTTKDPSEHHPEGRLRQPYFGGWPRCAACCVGVFLPLNVLVIVSLMFGMLFGALEMAVEVAGNDAAVQSKMTQLQLFGRMEDVLERLPELCLAQMAQNKQAQDIQLVLADAMTNNALDDYLQLDSTLLNQQAIPGNQSVQELAQFLAKCGQEGGHFRDNWLQLFNRTEEEDAQQQQDLTFNYIRCVNRTNPLAFNFVMAPTQTDIEDSRPTSQAELYETSWTQSQQQLEALYREEGVSQVQAITQSFQEATGREKCAVNMPSAAWFWFTVMSTAGYGNQVPNSFGGRTMTYTLGFISILLFGGVLASTGTITTHIMNDTIHRLKRKVPQPVKVLFWGSLWMLWMLVMSSYFIMFQIQRMGVEMTLADAYWLAYISTTTIGFGDYYLNPEGLFIADLLILWTTFLFGFVLLSSFLTELSNLIGGALPNLGEKLQKDLKYAYESEVPEEVRRRDQEKPSRRSTFFRTSLSRDTASLGTADSPLAITERLDKQDPEIPAAANATTNEATTAEDDTSSGTTSQPEQQPQEAAPPPTESVATFINAGTDPAMAQAQLYYEGTLWGNLGHGDPPVSVRTFSGQRWFLVANGVYVRQFDIGPYSSYTFEF